MARHTFREIVLIILSLVLGLGILLLIASRLMNVAVRRSTAGTAGISAVAGGISLTLFSVVLVVLAIVVGIVLLLWRRPS